MRASESLQAGAKNQDYPGAYRTATTNNSSASVSCAVFIASGDEAEIGNSACNRILVNNRGHPSGAGRTDPVIEAVDCSILVTRSAIC
jgi:hypothetical protein